MSWLRNTSISFARQLSRSLDPRCDYEPQACYSSFTKHWQQAHDIIIKSQPHHLHDDVLGVVNHLEQLATLLVLEARARELNHSNSPATCLEYLLSENLLDKLYEWAICTGKYENAVRLEQLKLFGNLITHYSTQVIAAEPFLRPLLKLLSGFRNELPPPNLENQLVMVLNQLCVALMQNMKFIDLFFLTTHTQNGSQAEFIIVRLLLASVHREGATGACARDALLLCAKMSARSSQLAEFMLAGNTCPVLATGLSGLYSLLPRTLGARAQRLSADDVNAVHKLALFVDSLEFCNAVAQVAHPTIQSHLLDLLYQGFLVPVLGPALLQTKGRPLQSGAPEQAAATAYLELVVRCSTRGGLLRAVLRYVLQQEYDGARVVHVVLARLDGDTQLSLASLALVETLIDLNCEDVMIELVFKYLLDGHHLAPAHRRLQPDPATYRNAAVAFLSLNPNCCSRPLELTRRWVDDLALSGRRLVEYGKREDARRANAVLDGGIPMSNLVREVRFNYGNPNETLFGNYHAYICDARFEIMSRSIACEQWSAKYDSVTCPKRETNSTKETKEIDIPPATKEQDSLISVCTSGYGTLKTSDTSEKEQHSLSSLNDANVLAEDNTKMSSEQQTIDGKEHDSLISIESSGYDSFMYRMEENDDDGFAEESFIKSIVTTEENARDYDVDGRTARTWRASAESIIGPLLSSLLRQAASLLQASLATNCRVTGALSKLAALPAALLGALLLGSGLALQPNVPSLFQILSKLKQEVDELTDGLDNCGELVDKARVFLIHREMALVRTRTQLQAHDDSGPARPQDCPQPGSDAPFRRSEPKRRSFSTSISNMFHRRLSSSPSQQNALNNSTYNSSPQKRLVFTQEAYWDQSITLRSILNAVILDEWVKELSALCEEHALRLSANSYVDDTYIRTVAL